MLSPTGAAAAVIVEENLVLSAFSGVCALGAAVPPALTSCEGAAFDSAEPVLSTRTRRDGSGKGSSNAIIAVGGIVQSIKRYKCALRNPGTDRVSHQRKTRE